MMLDNAYEIFANSLPPNTGYSNSKNSYVNINSYGYIFEIKVRMYTRNYIKNYLLYRYKIGDTNNSKIIHDKFVYGTIKSEQTIFNSFRYAYSKINK